MNRFFIIFAILCSYAFAKNTGENTGENTVTSSGEYITITVFNDIHKVVPPVYLFNRASFLSAEFENDKMFDLDKDGKEESLLVTVRVRLKDRITSNGSTFNERFVTGWISVIKAKKLLADLAVELAKKAQDNK